MFNSTLIRDYVCAHPGCHAPLIEVWDQERQRHVVVCSANREHRGFWLKTTLAYREASERAEYNLLAEAFPVLARAEHPPLQESARTSIADLYGD